ncbi:SICA antigen [Plasmodium coatneyi]|uniref:SICA antigen n=1 Tax=Plasmodium coatneyi TaxID=208452 RepID=A0A1B1E6A0_9APIC|nr:SICA antigen [Plasmodium coatneyi]ANQ10480.1 SICA antigen [Plasmodium coatneyi]
MIWDELEEVFNDMMKNIEKDGGNDQGHCSTLGKDDNLDRPKELCKLLLRISFWMDGFVRENKGTVRDRWVPREKRIDVRKEQEELQHYYRCLLGNVIIIKMLGTHCDLEKVAQTVRDGRGFMRLSVGNTGPGNDVCKGVDVGSLNLAGKFMWEEIKEWINAYKGTGGEARRSTIGIKRQNKLQRIRAEGQDKTYCPHEKKTERETLEKLGITVPDDYDEDINLQNDSAPLEKNALVELVKDVRSIVGNNIGRKGGELDDTDIKQKIQEKRKELDQALQKHIHLPISGGATSSDSCDHFNKVKQKWFKNRKREEKNSWDVDEPKGIWGDIKGQLDNLSNAITHESTGDDGSCNNVTQTDETNKEANIKACNYIVKVLKHIYGITAESEKAEHKDNRTFSQTMECAILNAFIDKLRNEKPCVKDEAVNKAFEVGKQHMDSWCTDKEKNGNCYECTRGSHLNCKINDKKIGEKLKKKLDEDKNIQNIMKDICQTTSTTPAKETEGTEETGPPEVSEGSTIPTTPPKNIADTAVNWMRESKGHGSVQISIENPSSTQIDMDRSSDPYANGPIITGNDPDVLIPLLSSQFRKHPWNLNLGVLKLLKILFFLVQVVVLVVLNYKDHHNKYFALLGKRRKRYRRAYQVRGPSLHEQVIEHGMDHLGPREYYLVKERKPRSTPIKRRKKRSRRRMIIDIHLEVLNECQKGDVTLSKEDFFEILVQEFMGSGFIEEESAPKEKVQFLDSGF